MAKKDSKANKQGTIVIRKEEVVEAGHHGGAWKVAYADFVTAMMAFFLLMWLLNATTEDQRKGLADYFSPSNVFSHNSSGTGKPFGGHTAFDQGAMVSDRGAALVTMGNTPVPLEVEDDEFDTPATALTYRREQAKKKSEPNDAESVPAGSGPDDAASVARAANPPDRATAEAARQATEDRETRAEREKRETKDLQQAAQQLRDAVRDDPNLASIAHQLAIDMTPEGLRIQVLDEDRSPMFATGSAAPNERAAMLLQKVTPVLLRLNEGISIAGHTDAMPYKGTDRSNWELSVERANATRRLLAQAGLPEERIRHVTGNADREPLIPSDPNAAANRRIAIVVLRDYPKTGPQTGSRPEPSAVAPKAAAAAPGQPG